ncbi:nucleotidyltransferase [Bifidobacterium dolichotidis]|uniref:Nucleotidyltransferase n=1 Tax=Bifidobacterium dolichotidis TaxID=2306976 RepID=A0A430FPK7_9BIFI|nr:GrpB family protein [Bifidobacterium dolichotidis]RSX54763.1 nucleotidyltransferase [Bifidobacterium dolichotidis]
MTKHLQDMTLEELWQLFPIELVEHQAAWTVQYECMREHMAAALEQADIQQVRIHHIGSTTVPGIMAKPIVDMLVEVADEQQLTAVQTVLEQMDMLTMYADQTHIDLNYGYTEQGFADQVFHVHVRCAGDHDELYFRDYLLDHADVAKQYEQLKIALWHRFEHNRDAYTNAKTAFVRSTTAVAKQAYGPRYEQ